MVNGESGFGFYTWNGDRKFGSYTPIEGTEGWSINVTALASEFMSGVKIAVIASIVLGALSVFIAVIIVLRIAGRTY